MRPVDVKSNLCIDSSKEINDKVGDIVRISKFLQKGMFQIGLKTFIKKVKNTVPWTNVISDLKGEEIVETFPEKEL